MNIYCLAQILLEDTETDRQIENVHFISLVFLFKEGWPKDTIFHRIAELYNVKLHFSHYKLITSHYCQILNIRQRK
jgi:hypothetical protein